MKNHFWILTICDFSLHSFKATDSIWKVKSKLQPIWFRCWRSGMSIIPWSRTNRMQNILHLFLMLFSAEKNCRSVQHSEEKQTTMENNTNSLTRFNWILSKASEWKESSSCEVILMNSLCLRSLQEKNYGRPSQIPELQQHRCEEMLESQTKPSMNLLCCSRIIVCYVM